MKTITLLLILVILIGCVSCGLSGEYIEAEGTIKYIDLEGGFWGIQVADGRNFDPVNLPGSFKKDGLRVHVKLRPRDELAGTHMWGQMVQIEEIKAVDESK